MVSLTSFGTGDLLLRGNRTRRRSTRRGRLLPQQAREAAVLEDPAARLAGGAVEDRVLVVVDARERRAADVAGLAEPVVDPVGLLVRRAALAQLEAARELRVDRGGEPRDLLVVEVRREREGREPRGVQDLVRPRPPDA